VIVVQSTPLGVRYYDRFSGGRRGDIVVIGEIGVGKITLCQKTVELRERRSQ